MCEFWSGQCLLSSLLGLLGMFDYIRALSLNDDVDFSCLYQQPSLVDTDTSPVVDH